MICWAHVQVMAPTSHAWMQEKDICTTPRSVPFRVAASALSSRCRAWLGLGLGLGLRLGLGLGLLVTQGAVSRGC
jgi:hypothetical protein